LKKCEKIKIKAGLGQENGFGSAKSFWQIYIVEEM